MRARARVCTDLCVGTYYVGVSTCGRVSKFCTCAHAGASMDARACVSPHACMRQCVGGFSMTWCAGVRECGCVCMLPWRGTHVWASTCVCVCACAACTSTQLPSPKPASAVPLHMQAPTRAHTETDGQHPSTNAPLCIEATFAWQVHNDHDATDGPLDSIAVECDARADCSGAIATVA